jgi:hypothetical protein
LILLIFLAFGVGWVVWGLVKGGALILAGIAMGAVPLYAVFVGLRNAASYYRRP